MHSPSLSPAHLVIPTAASASQHTNMNNNNEDDEPVSAAFHTVSASHLGKFGDTTPGPRTPKSDGRSSDISMDGDETKTTPHLSIPFARFPAHFLLSNFFFATFLISFFIFIIFSAVTWLTVLRDVQSMNNREFSNATGVSLCFYNNEWIMVMTFSAVGLATRSHPSTGPGHTHVIYLMESCRLRCRHYL